MRGGTLLSTALFLLLFPARQVPGAPLLTVAVGGDVMPGRGVAWQAERVENAIYPFAAVAAFLRTADLAGANLECPLIPGTRILPGTLRLHADPSVASLLARAGFDFLSLANNHAWDYGTAGLTATKTALATAGIQGTDGLDGSVLTAGGQRVGILSLCTPEVPRGNSTVSPAALAQAVHQLRRRVDAVIVSLHAGQEYERQPTLSQRQYTRAALDAGAALVFGHHAHVLQPAVWRGQALAFYGLGNLVFDQMRRAATRESVIARVHLRAGKVCATELLPVTQRQCGRPEPLTGTAARRVVQRLDLPALPAFSRAGDVWLESFLLLPPGATGKYADYHTADLDGDGQTERLRLQGSRAILYRGERVLWRSPRAWQVSDGILADLNGDGRAEIAMALWKRDSTGRSPRLFLYGWTRGGWKPRWGSSAIDRPILALAPLERRAGLPPEIAVMEAGESPQKRTLSVWRWNGWGFTCVWRSRPGTFTGVRALGPALLGMN